jgi:NAD+ diphosphatase
LNPTGEVRLKQYFGMYPFQKLNQLLIIYIVEISGDIRIDKNELEEYKLIEKEKIVPWKLGTGPAIMDFLKSNL